MSISSPNKIQVVALLLLAGCSRVEQREASPAVKVGTEVVHAGSVPQLQITTGTVRSSTASALSAKLMGNVTRVLVSEGDRVRAGQPLVEIDDREVRAKTDQAVAGGREVEQAIDGASAAVTAAEASAALANATYKRFAALRERGSVSPQEFEEVTARRAGADAQLEQTRRGRDALLARRSQARAAVTEAQTFLAYSVVRSPIDGIVTARFVDPGAQAAPGMPLVAVEDPSHYRVETTVDEQLARSVRAGDPVVIDLEGRHVKARVTHIAPLLDPSTRSALVKIDLPPDADTRSGSFVRVGFAAGTRNALTVPAGAVHRQGQLTSVYVVDGGGIARMRLVTLGDERGGRVEVLSGLDDGERIAARITNDLREGLRVAGEASPGGAS